jgi:[protein-PII] uridylyltransferase
MDIDTDILMNPKSLALSISKILSKNKGNVSKTREGLVAVLSNTIESARKKAESSLKRHGNGIRTARSISEFQDTLIKTMYEFIVQNVYSPKDQKNIDKICLVAVGGYGRGTLAPFSDIDLLFLHSNKLNNWTESVIEYMLYILWDLGFKVGHATRNLDQCLELSKSDLTIRTSILEARYIHGHKDLYEKLIQRFNTEIVAKTADEFIEMKLDERDKRHNTYGSSRFLVEPNVKESKGGLRDLHTLFWIGKYLFRTQALDDLTKNDQFLTSSELNSFKKAEDFLWVVRCHLHFISNRDNEVLTFDKQLELASRLGYAKRPGQKDVERFMKHYFMTAKEVGNLTRIVCASLEKKSIKKDPTVYKVLDNLLSFRKKDNKETNFYTKKGRLYTKDNFSFNKNKLDLIRLFIVADQDNVLLSPEIIQSINRSLKIIDNDLRNNKLANKTFLDLFSNSREPETILRNMNDAGVLAKFLPDFARVEGMSLFNLYHNYTVDEHLLKTVGFMSKIINNTLSQPHPFTSNFNAKLDNKKVLLLSAFLHDIGKGRKQDHSILGSQITEKLCNRIGMKKNEVSQTAWLVKNHLVMSDVAQKRDLYDPKTIVDFASIVKNQKNLDYLLALTVADIMSVGPSIWNAWKSGLLRTLYNETSNYLSGDKNKSIENENNCIKAQNKFKEELSDWPKLLMNSYVHRFSNNYWLTTSIEQQIEHAKILKDKDSKNISLEIYSKKNTNNNTTTITLIGPDYPNLLETLAGACSLYDANIIDAQIETTIDGIAIDTISVSRDFQDQDEDRRIIRISDCIKKSLSGELSLDREISKKVTKIRYEKTFKVSNKVNITNEFSNNSTVIEIEGRDRPGLLYQIANTLKETNINIKSAHIVTFGEKANDIFYITNLFGEKIYTPEKLLLIKSMLLSSMEENA